MKINTSTYERIYEEFKIYHPYMIDQVCEVRPWSSSSILVITNDGGRFSFDKYSKAIRRLGVNEPTDINDITDENTRELFAANLVDLMQSRGFSQRSLAERTGLSVGVISNYLNKRTTPTVSAAYKLAMALECSIGDLTGC